MKKTFVTFAVFIFSAALVAAQDADKIVQTAKDNMGGFGSGGNMASADTLTLTKRGGSTSVMKIRQWSKDDAAGNTRTVVQFNEPATVRGTRFLSKDKTGGGSDQWIFMPELRRVRRIASSESGGSFMGTDFSYDDISITGRDDSGDSHKILRSENYDGADCWVIETDIADKGYQYRKTVSWIDKAQNLDRKMELYDKKGLVKVLELSGYKAVKGATQMHQTPFQMKMTTLKDNTNTVLAVNKIQYDLSEKALPEGVFTTTFLRTGRP
jgi:outer membrane lipoprotein-sorting protein